MSSGNKETTVSVSSININKLDSVRVRLPLLIYLKYADDAAIIPLFNKDNVYFLVHQHSIAYFSTWCDDNFLHLNISKTKESILRKSGTFQISWHYIGSTTQLQPAHSSAVNRDWQLSIKPDICLFSLYGAICFLSNANSY